ncbi:hypothetical protein BCT63_05810 [Vibrio kanaloae]|uniref:hypothetical protein n=3 Tax=Vibrio kanaloae TaxID=170673 RepID=UPI000C84DB8C|nr:hypothetical protein [Vibrio kanaloae]PMM06846.1 hypothetical protein BCT63_05810 [Vibrio kanaloae]TKE97001.1 hypothetical protein FCV44_10330 [Vibrio kanaloae]
MDIEKVFLNFGTMQKEKDHYTEWFDEIVCDNSEYVETYGFDTDLEDEEKYRLFLDSNHEKVDSCIKESLVAKIGFDHKGEPVKDQNLSSVPVSLERSKNWHKLEDLDNKHKVKVLDSLNFAPFLQEDMSIEVGENEYNFTLNAIYEDHGFKYFITESDGFDNDDFMNIQELKCFIVNGINNSEDFEAISLKDIKIKEVSINENSADYELLQLEEMDRNLPENHYLIIDNGDNIDYYKAEWVFTNELLSLYHYNIEDHKQLENLVINESTEIDKEKVVKNESDKQKVMKRRI